MEKDDIKKNKEKIHTMDVILVIMAILLIIFTALMIYTFWTYNSVPDTLIVAFFGAFGCEGGFMAAIKINKDKFPDIPYIQDTGSTEEDLS